MPANVYDTTFPPDTQLANLLGQDLRNFRLDVQQRMALISGTLATRWNPGTDAQPANWTGLLYFATDTQQLFQWSGTVWVQISFTGSLVGSLNLPGQNAVVPNTTLYNVPASGAGLYRVTVHIQITATGSPGSGTVTPIVNYTNLFGSVGRPGVALGVSIVGGESDMVGSTSLATSIVIDSVASQPISVATSFNGVGAAPTYNLRARAEFLG